MVENFKDKNRRRAPRTDVAFSLTYGVEKPYSLRVLLGLNDDIDALMRDLSDSGVAMITKFELPRGAQLHIKFNFINLFLTGQERSRRMEISAEVVSCADLGKGSYRVGTRFNNISEEDKAAIRNFIKRSW
ncbi:MAG: PilZ domain-containing protein [Candidatus Omnitrophica bacterium]|nr:PilZ domain-containing protein [Candidatus Omnitrophota bacterium]